MSWDISSRSQLSTLWASPDGEFSLITAGSTTYKMRVRSMTLVSRAKKHMIQKTFLKSMGTGLISQVITDQSEREMLKTKPKWKIFPRHCLSNLSKDKLKKRPRAMKDLQAWTWCSLHLRTHQFPSTKMRNTALRSIRKWRTWENEKTPAFSRAFSPNSNRTSKKTEGIRNHLVWNLMDQFYTIGNWLEKMM